jgi:hypothetical protein
MVNAGARMALFDGDDTVYPAHWDGVHRVVQKFEAAVKLQPHWPTILPHSYAELEAQAGESFQALERVGKMSAERYLAMDEDTAMTARLFLQYTLSLNSQYTGTGYTADDSGGGGTPEFLAENRRLTASRRAR